MRAFALPKMLLIDGLDGSGKKTIATQMEHILTKAGYRVFVLDPPYYDTPAGKLVSDYLTKGYKDIRDRSLTSLYYTVDRMNFLRENFERIFFADPRYDFVIANRWSLSSLLYQTTVYPQKDAYTIQCTHSAVSADAGDLLPRCGRRYTIYLRDGNRVQIMNLEDLYQQVVWLSTRDPYGQDYRDLSFVLNHVRAQLVREHANLLYRLEMMPWWIEHDEKTYLPFANFRSVVLLPDIETTRENMMRRVHGDVSKLDNNEVSFNYLTSVAENIRWIHKHEALIFAHTCPDSDDGELEPITSVEGAVRVLNRTLPGGQTYFLLSPAQLTPIEPVEAPARSFNYTIVDTCHVTNTLNDGPMLVQKSKKQVLQEVWTAFQLNLFHQLTEKDLIFPDD